MTDSWEAPQVAYQTHLSVESRFFVAGDYLMAWIKLDDQWMEHPKIIRAGRDARDMWLASITWCAKYSTDGYFPENLIPALAVIAGIDVANCQTFARLLLDVCLWDATDNGYVVHDYLKYNPSKEEVNATREARKVAGKAGGVAKSSKFLANSQANAMANSWQNPAPSPYPLKELTSEPKTPAEAFVCKAESWIGQMYGSKDDADTIDVMIQEYGLERVQRAASWIKEKDTAHTMRAALKAMNTSLANGSFKPENGSKGGTRKVSAHHQELIDQV